MNDYLYERLTYKIENCRFRKIKQIEEIISEETGEEIRLKYKGTDNVFKDGRFSTWLESEGEELEIDYIRDNENRFYITGVY